MKSMLARIIFKMLEKIEGQCVNCGSTNVGFIQNNGTVQFACRDCGSTEISNVKFEHAKKIFSMNYVKDVAIKKV